MNIDKQKYKDLIVNFLIPIVCVLVTAILFFVVAFPSYKKLPELKSELAETQKLRDQLDEKQNKLLKFVDFQKVLDENVAIVNQAVPDEQNVPGLLDQLNRITDESGLNITKLSYSLGETGGDVDTPTFKAVLVSLGAEGTYDQLMVFMEAVENASRLVSVSNFRYNAVNANESNKLAMTFILSAPYVKIQSSAVTDEPIVLDISGTEFISIINKIKGLRYFEKSGDLSNIKVTVTEEKSLDLTKEATPSASLSGSN